MMHQLPEGGRAQPTLEDVARAAGVSRATVSRVVNGGTLVSPDTVLVVSEAIEALGYKPNRAARALVTNKAQAVAVVVTETDDRVFSDPFFPRRTTARCRRSATWRSRSSSPWRSPARRPAR